MPSVSAIILGGDFNTNKDQPLFISERTLDVIQEAGFANVHEGARCPLVLRTPEREGIQTPRSIICSAKTSIKLESRQ
jgi:hypothetical protein